MDIPMEHFDSNSLQLYHRPIVILMAALVQDSKHPISMEYMISMMWVPYGNTKVTVDNPYIHQWPVYVVMPFQFTTKTQIKHPNTTFQLQFNWKPNMVHQTLFNLVIGRILSAWLPLGWFSLTANRFLHIQFFQFFNKKNRELL